MVVVVEDDFFCEQRCFVLIDQGFRPWTNVCMLTVFQKGPAYNKSAKWLAPVDNRAVVPNLSTDLLA